MRYHIGLAIFGLLAASSSPAFAQAAAESAIIHSGQGGTGAAARTLGSNVRGSIGGAADAIAATNARRSAGSARSGRAGNGNRSQGGQRAPYYIAGNIDALEYFDVPTWQLGNGRILKVSGELVPDFATVCLQYCE